MNDSAHAVRIIIHLQEKIFTSRFVSAKYHYRTPDSDAVPNHLKQYIISVKFVVICQVYYAFSIEPKKYLEPIHYHVRLDPAIDITVYPSDLLTINNKHNDKSREKHEPITSITAIAASKLQYFLKCRIRLINHLLALLLPHGAGEHHVRLPRFSSPALLQSLLLSHTSADTADVLSLIGGVLGYHLHLSVLNNVILGLHLVVCDAYAVLLLAVLVHSDNNGT